MESVLHGMQLSCLRRYPLLTPMASGLLEFTFSASESLYRDNTRIKPTSGSAKNLGSTFTGNRRLGGNRRQGLFRMHHTVWSFSLPVLRLLATLPPKNRGHTALM